MTMGLLRVKRNQLRTRLASAKPLAAQQLGLLTTAQLLQFGIANRTALKRLKDAGELALVFHGVWRLTDAAPTEHQRWLAACLRVEGSVLSHHSAARFYGLDIDRTDTVHVLKATGRVEVEDAIAVHQTSVLAESAVKTFGALRVTTVERTLLDLAAELDLLRLHVVLESAWRKGFIDPGRFARALSRVQRKGTRGISLVRWLLREAIRRGRPLESPLEVRVWRALRDARPRLPVPHTQTEVRDVHGHPMRADFVFLRQRLAVEAQGFEKHGTREAFEKDAVRMARLVAAGYSVLPVTYRMIEDLPGAVVSWVREALFARRDLPPRIFIQDDTLPPEKVRATITFLP